MATGLIAVATILYLGATWLIFRTSEKAQKAAAFTRIRDKWSSLDQLMLTSAGVFHENSGQPARGLLLDNRLPNLDKRLYVVYLFLGAVEEALIHEKNGLITREYLSHLSETVQEALKMDSLADFWPHVKDQYPKNVQDYIEGQLKKAGVAPREIAVGGGQVHGHR